MTPPRMLISVAVAAGVASAYVLPSPAYSPALASRAACAASPFMCAQDDGEPLGSPEVSLVEEGTGRTLPCYLAAALEHEGVEYAALYPVDAPCSLAEVVGERLMPIDAELETSELIQAAIAACAEVDIELVETPVVLTAKGAGLDAAEEDAEAVDFADDDDDEEGEEALVLAEINFGGKDILVVQTLDPLYVVGKKADGSNYGIPSDAEIEAVSDTIEELVVEFEEGMEAMMDDDDDFDA